MKLALIVVSISKGSYSLGVCSILTYLEKYANFKDGIIIDANYEDIFKRLEEFKPDVVGLSAMTIYYPTAIKVARKIKEKYGIPIIIGGNHISTLPESMESCFDIGVISEGEETMKELVELYLDKGKFSSDDLKYVKGIVFHKDSKLIKTEPRPLIMPLDKVPIPNREYLNKNYFKKNRNFGTGDIEICYRLPASRGCPYKCRFCSPAIMWGGKVRFNSIERIVEEVRIGIEKYHATVIHFSDDLFAVSKVRLRELYEKLKETNLLGKSKFSGSIRANLVDDELCILLKKLNFVHVAVGFESGNKEILNYLKAGSVKVEDNYNTLRLLEKHKIKCFASFIFGNPGETLKQMEDTLNLIKFAYKHHIEFIYVYILKPFPGTEVWDIAEKKGLVSNDTHWEGLTTFVDGVNDENKPILLNNDISIDDFKKIHNKALLYSRLVAARRFLKFSLKHPLISMKEIGNPFVFIKKAFMKTNTLKMIREQKGI